MAEDEAKPAGMKAEDWTLQDKQALGTVRLSLAKNVAYNVVNEKTTYNLFKALSSMYEKPSASNKVFLIRQLVNTKMKEGASAANHSGTVIDVSGSTGSTKLKFDNIRDLVLGEDIRRKTSGEYSNSLLSAEDKGRGRKKDKGQKYNRSRSKSKKKGQSKNRQDITKVRLADDKTLDIASVGDVILKTSFGTSCSLKDVRYIPGLKKRLISVGQLDEERYHVGFGDQYWKVTKGSLVVAHGNKRGSLYMVEDWWFGEAEESFLHNVIKDKETTGVRATGVANGIVMLKMVPETPLQFGVAERLSRTFRAESTGIRVEAPKMLWADSVSTTYLIYRIPYVSIGLRIPEEEWQGKDTSLTHLKAAAQMKCDTAFGIRRVTKLSEADISHLWTRFMEPKNDSIVAEHGLSSEITQSPGGSSDTSEGSENSGSFEDSGRSDEEDSKDGASSKEGDSEIPQVQSTSRESRAPVRKEGITKIVDVQGQRIAARRYKARLVVNALKRGLSASWAERKPRVQIEGNYVWTDSSTEAMMKDRCSKKQVLGYVLTAGITTVEWESGLQKSITIYTKSSIYLAKNLKVCCWVKLVRILISEGSLSLLKILRTKSLAAMFTRLVMKEKLKFYAASTGLRVN
ncbi:hypothetical protein Tco_0533938 [Tanacetum coccineum]